MIPSYWEFRYRKEKTPPRPLVLMTPAIEALEARGYQFTLHLYAANTGGNYGMKAAEKMALDPDQVFKSLVVHLEGKDPVIALVPVSKQLNMKRLAKVAGTKRASMLATEDAEKLTGYVIGGICPIGLKKSLQIFADSALQRFHNVFISGGKRGLELEMNSNDLLTITNATVVDIAD